MKLSTPPKSRRRSILYPHIAPSRYLAHRALLLLQLRHTSNCVASAFPSFVPLCSISLLVLSTMTDLRPSSPDITDAEQGRGSLFKSLSKKASTYHGRVPYLRKLPFHAIAIIVTLIAVNLVVWAAVGIVLVGAMFEGITRSR
jgi:hypothetical protein